MIRSLAQRRAVMRAVRMASMGAVDVTGRLASRWGNMLPLRVHPARLIGALRRIEPAFRKPGKVRVVQGMMGPLAALGKRNLTVLIHPLDSPLEQTVDRRFAGKRWVVVMPRKSHVDRSSASLAHELGHLLERPPGKPRAFQRRMGAVAHEKFANRQALRLLKAAGVGPVGRFAYRVNQLLPLATYRVHRLLERMPQYRVRKGGQVLRWPRRRRGLPLSGRIAFRLTDAYARAFSHPTVGPILRRIVQP